MSIRVMAQVWANSHAKGSALLLLLAIADHSGDDGVGYPGVETLAQKIRMSERRTRDLLRELETDPRHELTTERNAGPQGTNRYTVRPGGQSLPPLRQLRGGDPASKGGAVATAPEPGTEPGTRYVAVSTKPPRAARQAKSSEAKAAGEVVAAYSRYCRDHSIPTPSRSDIAIMSTQAMNLARGGYAERDVREEALIIAGEFDLIHGHRGMTQLQRRVEQRYEDQRVEEHERTIAESREVSPDVAAAMGSLKLIPPRKTLPTEDPRDVLGPTRADARQPESPGERCEACRHFAIEHGAGKCASCERIGRECAA